MLLAFAGIPLSSGFASEFAVFATASGGGAGVLVVVGVISNAIAAAFYIRGIVVMFDSRAGSDEDSDDVGSVSPTVWTTSTITVAAVATVALGVAPQPLLDLVDCAAMFVS